MNLWLSCICLYSGLHAAFFLFCPTLPLYFTLSICYPNKSSVARSFISWIRWNKLLPYFLYLSHSIDKVWVFGTLYACLWQFHEHQFHCIFGIISKTKKYSRFEQLEYSDWMKCIAEHNNIQINTDFSYSIRKYSFYSQPIQSVT